MYSPELMNFLMQYQKKDEEKIECPINVVDDSEIREIFYAPRKPVMIPIYRGE